MLVINRIELVAFNQPEEMRKLHGNNSAWLQKQLQSGDKVHQIRNMRQHVIPHDEVRLLSVNL